jgi:putative molybdopterin biosynthesis protein
VQIQRGYLDCRQREEVQQLWRRKLTDCGYFADLPAETVAVDAALGRVTARTHYARQSVPHYNGAAMDGIAVRAQDTATAKETSPLRLTLLPAGAPFTAGGCYSVDTGDPLPGGTNAVIMIEDVQPRDSGAEIIAAAVPWQHVRIIGEDIVVHEMVVPEHQVISPVDIAALLAAGLEEVEVVKKPAVAIIPTGDEIVATVADLKAGTILDVNSHMLAAAVASWGGQPQSRPIVADDFPAIRRAVLDALAANDMVIINAGTSAGREDFTAKVLGDLGEVVAHGVAIKPGKPVVLAVCQGKPVIGLPGYPVSAYLTAELFVRDCLLARQQLPPATPPTTKATLARQVASTVGVEEYVRVSLGTLGGKVVATPLGRGAGVISSLTKAQGIVVIDRTSPGLSAGAVVDATLLSGSRPENNLLAIGSHDLALDILGVHLRRRLEGASLSCANVGSMGGIQAIRSGEAHIAGIHLLDEATGEYNLSFVRRYLPAGDWRLVRLARRQQGLILPAGNPKKITGLADLAKPGITFVNRQRGSGTRALLDWELAKTGIVPATINGYEKEVATHMAVAATVAYGVADAGLGIAAAARALDLAFLPVADEQYDLILNFAAADERLAVILEILGDGEFRREVEALGGYDLSEAGRIIAVGK